MVPSQIGWIRHLQLVPSRRLKGKAQAKLFSAANGPDYRSYYHWRFPFGAAPIMSRMTGLGGSGRILNRQVNALGRRR